MKDYERLRDSLICSRNDEIDNTAHDLICSIVSNKSEGEQTAALIELIGALMVEGDTATVIPDDEVDPNATTYDATKTLNAVKDLVAGFDIPPVRDPEDDIEWNMEWIALVTELVSGEFDRNSIPICHPYFVNGEDIGPETKHYDAENDGVLCCLSKDRCSWCRKTTE